MLAARGLDPARIQALGRWRSPLVVHYATEALSTGLAAIVGRSAVANPAVAAADTVAPLSRLVAQLQCRIAALEALEPAVPSAATAAPPVARLPLELVLNTDPNSGAVHRESGARAGASYCGWAFATRKHRRLEKLPEAGELKRGWKSICAYCLPLDRECARLEFEAATDGFALDSDVEIV